MNKETEKELVTETEVTAEAQENASDLESIRQQVFEIIEDLCLIQIPDADQTLLGDLALDSLRMVMLLVTLEDTFEIELDESDMNPFALITVQDVIDLVSKYLIPSKEDEADV